MHLQELFPCFAGFSPPPPPPPQDVGRMLVCQVPGGHCCRWVFDGDPASLPELLDSIWTAAAEQWVTFRHAVTLSRLAILEHAKLGAVTVITPGDLVSQLLDVPEEA